MPFAVGAAVRRLVRPGVARRGLAGKAVGECGGQDHRDQDHERRIPDGGEHPAPRSTWVRRPAARRHRRAATGSTRPPGRCSRRGGARTTRRRSRPCSRSRSRSSSERSRKSRSCSSRSRSSAGRASPSLTLPAPDPDRPRRVSRTSASSSSVAWRRSVARQRRNANQSPIPPPTSTSNGRPHTRSPRPLARRLEQDRLAVAVDVRPPDRGVRLTLGHPLLQVAADGPGRRRLGVGGGQALAVGAAELAGERAGPVGVGGLARRPGRPHQQSRHDDAEQDPGDPATPTAHWAVPPAAAARQRFEVGDRRRTELVAHDQPIGTDREGLGLTPGPERQCGAATLVHRDRPLVAAVAHPPLDRWNGCRLERSRASRSSGHRRASRRTPGAPALPGDTGCTTCSRSSRS